VIIVIIKITESVKAPISPFQRGLGGFARKRKLKKSSRNIEMGYILLHLLQRRNILAGFGNN